MSALKGKNTKPEIMLHKSLFNKGFKYTIHPKNVEGKPDFYIKIFNIIL